MKSFFVQLPLKGVVPDFPDFRDSHQLQLAPFELAERSIHFFCARFPMETAIIQTLWEWWIILCQTRYEYSNHKNTIYKSPIILGIKIAHLSFKDDPLRWIKPKKGRTGWEIC